MERWDIQWYKSDSFMIYSEYETVFLIINKTNEEVVIGDFYGDVDDILVSKDEKICVMCGAGVVVYFLTSPYRNYTYHISNTNNKQWKEFYRYGTSLKWFDRVEEINKTFIKVISEFNKEITISLD